MARDAQLARPLIFGEVLFDCFEDGTEVLGGAPFNVAWHLAGFGLDPLFVSRVGRDPQGAAVRQRMADWGLRTEGLQLDDRHPTGRVEVRMLADGGHRFEILADQAYDHIDPAPVTALLERLPADLLYHGSLAVRAPASAAALAALRARGLPRFVDINLRAPWWQPEPVRELMAGARWLKLNDEELDLLQPGEAGPGARARALREANGHDWLILTRGAAGATLYTADGEFSGTPPWIEVVDTVGAGDAFAAVCLLGLIEGWPAARTLERALAFAARICGQRGATAPDRALYASLRERWQS